MRVVVVEAAVFERAFAQTLERLELAKLRERGTIDAEEMHRKFHYEVCLLRERLEGAR